MQYEIPITSGKKVMAKVKGSRSQGQNLWYQVKGLVTSNTHVQHESPISCC